MLAADIRFRLESGAGMERGKLGVSTPNLESLQETLEQAGKTRMLLLCYFGVNEKFEIATESLPGSRKPNFPLEKRRPDSSQLSKTVHCEPL